MNGALPGMRMFVNGVNCNALIDTGCTRCIIYAPLCAQWKKENINVTTVSGEHYQCMGTSSVSIQLFSGASVTMSALVVTFKPLNYDFILGMNCVMALHGVTVYSCDNIYFGIENVHSVAAVGTPATINLDAKDVESKVANDSLALEFEETPENICIDEKNFKVTYSRQIKKWTVSWKWCDDAGPSRLQNSVSEYAVPQDVRQEYEDELSRWIEDGWLIPYDETIHGPVRGTIPLMAVVQQHKNKVRPVLDFRELNSYVDAHTAEADVCAEKLREWRKQGQMIALMDLHKAYLQIHVYPSLWSCQTVVFRKRRYCLARMGFGLNIAPLVLKKKSLVLCSAGMKGLIRLPRRTWMTSW